MAEPMDLDVDVDLSKVMAPTAAGLSGPVMRRTFINFFVVDPDKPLPTLTTCPDHPSDQWSSEEEGKAFRDRLRQHMGKARLGWGYSGYMCYSSVHLPVAGSAVCVFLSWCVSPTVLTLPACGSVCMCVFLDAPPYLLWMQVWQLRVVHGRFCLW